ncbi:oligosaccharide flippase family protein [Candidatus Pacearchaeota archaeon]|nr:oligosaccharide flippase family protein [Candidatus Pacearchaeota archaeon]
MARMLGPAEYGVFAVIMALFYFMAVPADSIQTIISKYTSKLKVKNEYGKIKLLLIKSLKRGFIAATILFLIFLPIFFVFSYTLDISFWLVTLSGLMLFMFFTIPVTRGLMQGLKKFKALGTNMVIDSSIKVILAIGFVFLGLKVYGAVLSIILGSLIALVFSLVPLKTILNKNKEYSDFHGIYKYSWPVLFVLLAILLMQSVDVIIAKKFFPPEIAGQYAVANLIGKMIFFGTLSISKAMFPLSSEEFEGNGDGKKTKSIFYKSLIIVSGICIISLLALALFPETIISLLFGEQYLYASNILLNIGIAFSFISLSNLVLIYGLSINKKIPTHYMLTFILIQAILLFFMRGSLLNLSIGMLISTALLFLGSLVIIRKKG